MCVLVDESSLQIWSYEPTNELRVLHFFVELTNELSLRSRVRCTTPIVTGGRGDDQGMSLTIAESICDVSGQVVDLSEDISERTTKL